MDILLISLFARLTSWILPLSLIILSISVVVDILKKKFYWTKFALIFLSVTTFLLIIQIAFTYHLAKSIINNPTQTSTSIETDNWKTYTNTNHYFLLKYPPNWLETGDENKKYTLFEQETKFEEPVIGLRKGLSITVHEGLGNLTGQQFLDQVYYKDYTPDELFLKQMYIKNNKYETVIVDNIPATTFDLTAPHGSNGTGVWIAKNNYGILLRFYPTEGEEELIKPILSTFKFTN